MGRLGLGAVFAAAVACGGRAERAEPYAPSPEGGGSAGSTGANANPFGGMAIGGGGADSSAAGQGGTSVSQSGAGGRTTWACDEGSVVKYPELGAPGAPQGFTGTMDQAPIMLAAAEPNQPAALPGTIQVIAGGCGSLFYDIDLYFEAPYEGQFLHLYTSLDDRCHISAMYSLSPDILNPFRTEVTLDLEVWPSSLGGDMPGFEPPSIAKGSFSADVRSPDGIPVHTIEGEFTLAVPPHNCIGG